MPMASSSLRSGCHDGSVVSIAELLELGVLEKVLCDGDVRVMLAGGIMDCGGGAECEE